MWGGWYSAFPWFIQAFGGAAHSPHLFSIFTPSQVTFRVTGPVTLTVQPSCSATGLPPGELPLRPLLDALCLDHVILLFLAGGGGGGPPQFYWTASTTCFSPSSPSSPHFIHTCQSSWSGVCCCAAATTACSPSSARGSGSCSTPSGCCTSTAQSCPQSWQIMSR